jgi:hypothetical protein
MVRETRRAPLPPAREVPKSSSVACDPFTTENMLPRLSKPTSERSPIYVYLRRSLLDLSARCFSFAVANSVNSRRSTNTSPPWIRATGPIGSDQRRDRSSIENQRNTSFQIRRNGSAKTLRTIKQIAWIQFHIFQASAVAKRHRARRARTSAVHRESLRAT